MHILLIKTSSMGDVIHALPALSDAQRFIPNLTVDWVVEEGFAEIPSWHCAVNKVLVIAIRRWRKDWRRAFKSGEMRAFWRELRATKYDCIIDAQGLYKSALIARLAFLKDGGERCGYSFNTARESWAALLYQHKFVVPTNQHAITRIRQLFASALGYEFIGDDLNYGIKEKIKRDCELQSLLLKTQASACRHEHAITQDENKYLLFIHGTSRATKCWMEEKWNELIQLANAAGFVVLLPWGSMAEKQRAERIAARGNRAQILPQLKLNSLAMLMQGARAVVTVDTGLGHLAAALEVPTLALYGSTRPELIGIIGKRTAHVSAMESVTAQEVWKKLMQTT